MTRSKSSVVLQATETECGLAALSSLMSAFGRHRSVRELRQQAPTGRGGATLLQLKQIALTEGFEARAFQHTGELDANQVPTPFLALWNDSHFVVVDRLGKRSARVMDPSSGFVDLPREEVDAGFSGVLLLIQPGSSFKADRRSRASLLQFVQPHLPRSTLGMMAFVLVSLAMGAAALAPPLLTRWVVDVGIPSRSLGAIQALGGLALVFGVCYGLTAYLRRELQLWFEKYLDASLMLRVFSHLLRLPYSYFLHRTTGDLLVRFSSMSYVRDLLSGQIIPMIVEVSFLLIYAVLLFSFHPVYLLFLLLVLGIYVALIALTAPRARQLADKEIQKSAEAQSVLLEALSGIETSKALAADQAAAGRFSKRFEEELSWSVRRSRLDNGIGAVFDGTSVAIPMLLVGLGGILYFQGGLTLGTMLAANTIAASAFAPVRSIGMTMQVMQTVRVHLERLRDITLEPEEETGTHLPDVEFAGAVTLRDVSFHYDGEAPILQDIDLDVRPGSFVAVLGPSGSGKSTLGRLLLSLLRPTHGVVAYDGIPSGEVNLESVRSQVGLVTQDVTAMAGTIEENISYGRELDLESVIQASRLAGLHDDVLQMALGYSTPLGEGGLGLSGGQRQRLAIARAVAHRPRLLVLDEATSHLDPNLEHQVMRGLEEMGVTRVVIAHRLSTLLDADQMVYLADGKIVATGSHEDLLDIEGYRTFLERQMIHD